MKTIAIMQPTFLPWLGWFDLLDQVDQMILLDDVGFSKQSWQQRNRIRVVDGLQYMTVPVTTSGRHGQLIRDARLSHDRFIEKMLRTIQAHYAKSPFFSQYFDTLSLTLRHVVMSQRLLDLNFELIQWLAQQLGIDSPMVLASTFEVSGERGEHVAQLCASAGADNYLSPLGAAEYLQQDYMSFDKRDITVWLHQYEHPIYRQCFTPFIPYASVIDLLFNEGAASLSIIRSGRRQPIMLTREGNL